MGQRIICFNFRKPKVDQNNRFLATNNHIYNIYNILQKKITKNILLRQHILLTNEIFCAINLTTVNYYACKYLKHQCAVDCL